GQPQAEVFLAQGVKPGTWNQLPRGANGAPKKLDRTFTAAAQLALSRPLQRGPGGSPHFQFVATEPESDEVRMNRAAFDTVRDKTLYSREGLKAAFAAATAGTTPNRDFIQFTPA